MNKRIKELAEQAGMEYHSDHQFDAFSEEKFAEFIVQKCADLLRKESEIFYKLASEEKDELFASNFQICAEKCRDNEVMIKKHFGVE